MRWKGRKEKDAVLTGDDHEMDNPKKQSLSSTTSMSFLRDENLTFHRFTTDDSRRPSDDINSNGSTPRRSTLIIPHEEPERNFSPTVWTTTTSSSKSNYTTGTNEFHYIPGAGVHDISTKALQLQNGSTVKLLPSDDQTNKQSKCSIFRGVILCLCLNITYANVVRFPRELERHGIAFLIPYIIILLLVGLPIVLLEVALGQFLGQGSAYSWRASPICRGASVIGRFASWLGTIWVSMQAALAFVYVGELALNNVPLEKCSRISNSMVTGNSKNVIGYDIVGKPGQECIETSLLQPLWDNVSSFALLTMSLIVLWTIAAVCTYSAKTLRRTTLLVGLVSLGLLAFQTGWETSQIINDKKTSPFAALLNSFSEHSLINSSIWFNALVQVLFSTNIGTGVLPVLTGKFLYKGDAVRTSLVYVSFNILILGLSTTFFLTQFNNEYTRNSTIIYPELKPITSIYDNALENMDGDQARALAAVTYSIILLASLITIAISIYTASRLIRCHPNFVMSILALIVSLLATLCPKYVVARVLDTRLVGTLIICALVFDVIAITWIYGAKTIYTDLEFSIGRPISKLWVFLWCIAPLSLVGLLTWWSVSDNELDLGGHYLPRWAPIAVAVAIIILIACIEVYRQVDYNFCSMIHSAGVSSKDWGPADPIVRHAWKQWTSVCEDTGQKDFTLRRRGTRDYTHSIKKGQYSRNTNPSPYTNGSTNHAHTHKASTPGNNSPNYSGSIFGDSAIEEDISVGRYAGYHSNLHRVHSTLDDDSGHGGMRPLRYSNGSRKTNDSGRSRYNSQSDKHRHLYYVRPPPPPSVADKNSYNVSKIEITSNGDSIGYGTVLPKNPMARLDETRTTSIHIPISAQQLGPDNYGSFKRAMNGNGNIATGSSEYTSTYIGNKNGTDHIWRRQIPVNGEEFSTEL